MIKQRRPGYCVGGLSGELRRTASTPLDCVALQARPLGGELSRRAIGPHESEPRPPRRAGPPPGGRVGHRVPLSKSASCDHRPRIGNRACLCRGSVDSARSYKPPRRSCVAVSHRDGSGAAATEARAAYSIIAMRSAPTDWWRRATIVPPTSQNQAQIEADLRRLLSTLIDRGTAEIARDCERLVRSYDPCISCSTHFLKLDLKRS